MGGKAEAAGALVLLDMACDTGLGAELAIGGNPEEADGLAVVGLEPKMLWTALGAEPAMGGNAEEVEDLELVDMD